MLVQQPELDVLAGTVVASRWPLQHRCVLLPHALQFVARRSQKQPGSSGRSRRAQLWRRSRQRLLESASRWRGRTLLEAKAPPAKQAISRRSRPREGRHVPVRPSVSPIRRVASSRSLRTLARQLQQAQDKTERGAIDSESHKRNPMQMSGVETTKQRLSAFGRAPRLGEEAWRHTAREMAGGQATGPNERMNTRRVTSSPDFAAACFLLVVPCVAGACVCLHWRVPCLLSCVSFLRRRCCLRARPPPPLSLCSKLHRLPIHSPARPSPAPCTRSPYQVAPRRSLSRSPPPVRFPPTRLPAARPPTRQLVRRRHVTPQGAIILIVMSDRSQTARGSEVAGRRRNRARGKLGPSSKAEKDRARVYFPFSKYSPPPFWDFWGLNGFGAIVARQAW